MGFDILRYGQFRDYGPHLSFDAGLAKKLKEQLQFVVQGLLKLRIYLWLHHDVQHTKLVLQHRTEVIAFGYDFPSVV